MAYLFFTDDDLHGVHASTAKAPQAPSDVPTAHGARLSAIEWAVVALASKDPVSSLRSPGRIAVAMGALFGARQPARLVDPRLEALRRISILSWHQRYAVAASEVRDFLSAGFSEDQFELVVDSIEAARRKQIRRRRSHPAS